MEINTIRYVFENRQPELRRLVVKYGLTPAKNRQDLWNKVKYCVVKFKHEALKDIADIHPDKDLILWNEHSKNNKEVPTPISESDVKLPVKEENKSVEEKKSAACGCSGADGYSNCGGNPDCKCGNKSNRESSNVDGATISETLKSNMPLVIIGSLILVGGLIFLGSRTVKI